MGSKSGQDVYFSYLEADILWNYTNLKQLILNVPWVWKCELKKLPTLQREITLLPAGVQRAL